MRAGSMREKLTFFELVETQSPSGAVKKEWAPAYGCRAYFKKANPVYDKDGVEAREEFRGDNIYLIIRKTNKVNDLMRVEYNGMKYDIIPPIVPIYADNTLQIQIRRLNNE